MIRTFVTSKGSCKRLTMDGYFKGSGDGSYQTPAFGETVLQQMYTFYKEGQYCDFKIKVEGKTFDVHQLVFASSSDYFKAMLSHDMVETREECTNLKGMTLKGIEPLIRYVYTGDLEINLDNIQDVIAGATFLQIGGAIDLCTTFLKQSMTFENAEDLLKIGDLFSVPKLREYYRNFLLKNFLEFAESETFLKSDANVLADYLSDDRLVTTSESILFQHCLRWFNRDPKSRTKAAHIVFEQIRMCIDGMPLIHFANKQEIFQSNSECKQIVEYHKRFLDTAGASHILDTSHQTRVRSPRKTFIQIGGVMELNENYDSYRDIMMQPNDEPCGWNANHYFHPDLKAWFPLGKEGHQGSYRTSHQAFVEVNGKGVIVGGYEYELIGSTVSKIAIRDVKMFSAQRAFCLTDLPSLQHQRARHAAVLLDGHVYAIGGKDDTKVLKSVERLDLDKQRWSYVRAIPKKIHDHKACACDGKIYVTGGCQYSVRDAKKWVWCYDPKDNNWKKKSDMLHARAGHGMVCVSGHLYVYGGYNGNREATNPDAMLRCLVSMERYDPRTDQWTKMSAMKFGICFFETTVLDGRIIVMGGLDTDNHITQYMHEYDITLAKWKVFGELPRPLKNACCGAVTIKLTDFGCMEEQSDEVIKEYETAYSLEQSAQMESDRKCLLHENIRMMENFDPGDYLIYDDSYDEDDDIDVEDDHMYMF